MFTKKFPWIKKKEVPVKEEKFLTADAADSRAIVAAAQRGEDIDQDVLRKAVAAIKKKEREAEKVLDILGIPHEVCYSQPMVNAGQLVEILMNEKKFKEITIKLRMKAFW